MTTFSPSYSRCDHNKYLLQYLSHLGQLKAAEPPAKAAGDSDSGSDSDPDEVAMAEAGDSSDGETVMAVLRAS